MLAVRAAVADFTDGENLDSHQTLQLSKLALAQLAEGSTAVPIWSLHIPFGAMPIGYRALRSCQF